MSKRAEIPFYPNSTILYNESMSAAGGGGGMVHNYVTADPLEVVVAFYEERLGVAQRDTASGSATWHFPDAQEGWRGGRHLEVWPIDGAYPWRGSHGAYPQPPDARTVIHDSYMYVPAAPEEPDPGPPFI